MGAAPWSKSDNQPHPFATESAHSVREPPLTSLSVLSRRHRDVATTQPASEQVLPAASVNSPSTHTSQPPLGVARQPYRLEGNQPSAWSMSKRTRLEGT